MINEKESAKVFYDEMIENFAKFEKHVRDGFESAFLRDEIINTIKVVYTIDNAKDSYSIRVTSEHEGEL